MSDASIPIRGFTTTFTVIGVLYLLMAGSMLIRGVEALLDFGVSPELVAEPVLADFFSFFYQLMAYVGVLTIVCGHVARRRDTQLITAATFFVANVLLALRDLATSDSPFGNELYEGSDTLMFVAISAVFGLAFGVLAVLGMLGARRPSRP